MPRAPRPTAAQQEISTLCTQCGIRPRAPARKMGRPPTRCVPCMGTRPAGKSAEPRDRQLRPSKRELRQLENDAYGAEVWRLYLQKIGVPFYPRPDFRQPAQAATARQAEAPRAPGQHGHRADGKARPRQA